MPLHPHQARCVLRGRLPQLETLLGWHAATPACLTLHLLPPLSGCRAALPAVYGIYNESSRYRGYRKNTASGLVVVPTTNLYVVQSKLAGSGDSGDSSGDSSGGLSAGAIAGIAVGAVAGAAVLAGVAWAAVWRRRQRSAAAAAQDASLESGKASTAPWSGGSSGSDELGCKGDSTEDSLPPPSSAGNTSDPPVSPHSPSGGERAPLAELLERVASVEAAAASSLGASLAPSEHVLLSAESLPPRLQECLVPPSAVTYCHWPNGQPQEIGAGVTSRVYKAVLNGKGHGDEGRLGLRVQRCSRNRCLSWQRGGWPADTRGSWRCGAL